jgi:hypothetical protein
VEVARCCADRKKWFQQDRPAWSLSTSTVPTLIAAARHVHFFAWTEDSIVVDVRCCSVMIGWGMAKSRQCVL